MGSIKISLYSCMGCQKVIDNFMIQSGKYSNCSRCYGKHFKPLHPRLSIIIKYFLSYPIHALKLVWLDFRGK